VSAAKVLITGATGFMGQHLAREAVRRGLHVVALCRDPESNAARELPAEVERVRGDALDGDSVKRAAQGCSRLVHAAGLVSRDAADTLVLRSANVVATQVTLDAARQSGIERVVHISTSGTVAVSKSAQPIDEQAPTPIELINRWPYYRSKLYAERSALERSQPEQGFSVLAVNPSLLLGPGDMNGTATIDVQNVLAGRVLAVPTGGVAFADVRDVAHTTFDALAQGRPGARYLLSSCNAPLGTFCRWLAELGNVRAPTLRIPALEWARRGSVYLAERAHALGMSALMPDPVTIDMAQHYWYVDSSLAARELGWAPRDPLVTLRDTIEDLRARGFVG
jgi:dihydroflavonol-4-reductase